MAAAGTVAPEPPAALRMAIGNESTDFIARIERLSRRRETRRLARVGWLCIALAALLMGIFIGPVLMGEEQTAEVLGEETQISLADPSSLIAPLLMVGFFMLPGAGFLLMARNHTGKGGAWIAATPTRLLMQRKDRVQEQKWEALPPNLAIHDDPEGKTVVIGESRPHSVASHLRRPGIHLPEHPDADTIAALAWTHLRDAGRPPGTLPDGDDVTRERPPLPPFLQHEPLDFAAKGRRRGRPDLKMTIGGAFFVLLGLLVASLGVLGFIGAVETTETTGGMNEPVPAGSIDHLLFAGFGLAFATVGGLVFHFALIHPLRPGPWFLGTENALVVIERSTTRCTAWHGIREEIRHGGMFGARSVLLQYTSPHSLTFEERHLRKKPDMAILGVEAAPLIATRIAKRVGGRLVTSAGVPGRSTGSGRTFDA